MVCFRGTNFLARALNHFFQLEGLMTKGLLSLLTSIVLALILLFYVFKIEKRDMSSIGWKPFKAERDIK